jgi:glycine/D-amino acid oxidase-like deaminating enzyme
MQVLIVGAGLAGSSLTQHLLDKGVEVTLLDKGNNASSAVAGGILNPLVFRRMTLSWRIHELLPFAYDFYRQQEQRMGGTFLHLVPIRRFFASEQERGFWLKKQDDPEYAPFMQPQSDTDANFPDENNTFGTGVVLQSGYVEAAKYVELTQSYYQNAGILRQESMDYAELDPQLGRYKDVTYDYIVFAEGKDGKYNPWFGDLPLQQTKGEVLTVKIPELAQTESRNRKCFMMPIGNACFRVGSTYGWNTDDTVITELGKQTILENMRTVNHLPFELVGHVAGVRPTVVDRRPLLGKHPEYPRLVIANGLGTKGYILAPLVMKELADHLVEQKELHPETDIRRFDKN